MKRNINEVREQLKEKLLAIGENQNRNFKQK